MKIGLIGFGSIGERHYKNLGRYSKDIAVFTKRKDLVLPNIFGNWKSFAAKAPFDAVFIANETYKHLLTIKKCVGLKPKAIFVEKPLSHNTKGLKQTAKLLKQKKISLWVGYCLRFYEPLLRIKKIIRSKKLGKIYYLRAFAGGDLKVWRKRDYRRIYSAKKKQGGGAMLDLVHDINYPAWLLSDVLIPKASLAKKISSLEINTEDFAENILISKKGVVVSVHQDYLNVPGGRSLEIAGDKGTLYWDSMDNVLMIAARQGIFKKKIAVDRNDMYKKELKFFFHQMKTRKFFTNIDEAIEDMLNVEYLKKMARI